MQKTLLIGPYNAQTAKLASASVFRVNRRQVAEVAIIGLLLPIILEVFMNDLHF